MRWLLVAAALAASSAAAQTPDELRRMISQREAEIRELQKKLEEAERKGATARPRAAEEDEVDRALERTLVQQGALVLRPGTFELQPELSFAHWDKSRGALRRELDAALSFRAGLGWDSQFQVRAPYVHTTIAGGSATALGDIDLSLSRQFLRDSGGWPGLVGSVGWTARSGRDGFDGGAPTGSGFSSGHVGLTAVKRHDPLVYYGGVSYSTFTPRQISGVRVVPGDVLGVRFGGALAASPDTSVSLGLNLGFVNTTRFDGQAVPDSDTTLGTLQIGVGTLLTRNMLLNLSGDFRVTGNVPNFRLTATLPIRF